jgi:hypothetical protein
MKEYVERNCKEIELNLNQEKVCEMLKKIQEMGVLKWSLQPAI